MGVGIGLVVAVLVVGGGGGGDCKVVNDVAGLVEWVAFFAVIVVDVGRRVVLVVT